MKFKDASMSVLVLCAGFVTTGCIGGPSAEDFAGTWEGTETTTSSFNGQSETSVTPNTTITLSEGSSADVILDMSEENVTCVLRGNFEDDIVVFDSTTCTESQGGGTLVVSFDGEAEVVDDELNIELSGTTTFSTGGASASGTYFYTFEGDRL